MKDNEDMGEVLQEAFNVATTEPCGPVYLTLPRDIYTRPFERSKGEFLFNNQAYGAIKGLFRERYKIDNMGADITRPPDYDQVARACHAYGRMVEDPSDIVPVLEEALTRVRKGKPAVVDVRLSKPR
jgi:thiamine pyrophosphate-dependent acetolactate synthase large subunit-like protein